MASLEQRLSALLQQKSLTNEGTPSGLPWSSGKLYRLPDVLYVFEHK